MSLKILSWNIWIQGYFDQIADFLKKSNADIICLQEVKNDDPKRDIISFLNELGYKHVFTPNKRRWATEIINDGPAIFTKNDIKSTQTYILSESDSRAAIEARIDIKGQILHVFNTHLLHTHQQESKIQNEQAANLIKLLPDKLTILMGDFNALPESLVIQKIKKKLIASDLSFLPTWSVYPEGCPTCNPQDINMKLDYIFTTKDIKVKSFKVEKSRGSDHLPISVMIEL